MPTIREHERSAGEVPASDVRAMHSLDHRAVIVTGAGKGVGRGIALHLGKAGARIVVAEWDPELLEATTAELTGLGIANLGVACDISQREQLESMVTETVERFGRVDGLVNNAQTFRPTVPVAQVDEDDVDVLYASGVKGTLWAMQAVHPHMATQGWGRIVNFASSVGITGAPGFAAYSASKEAIRALTRTAAREWAPDGIVVNAVAPAAATHHGPGVTRTDEYRDFMARCPMGRQGDPELDIGAIVHFLCSDACRYLTGQTFMADGGANLWA